MIDDVQEWLESEGIELQCSELIPSDPYTLKLIEKQRMNSRDHKQRNDMDGKMLRFYGILDNRNQPCDGILRRFIINVISKRIIKNTSFFNFQFYLSDNTIEIREIHQTNNGYDPIPIYLHRQIVPKDPTYNISKEISIEN